VDPKLRPFGGPFSAGTNQGTNQDQTKMTLTQAQLNAFASLG